MHVGAKFKNELKSAHPAQFQSFTVSDVKLRGSMHAAFVVVGALLQLHACESYTLSESCQLPKSLGGEGPLPSAFGARSVPSTRACDRRRLLPRVFHGHRIDRPWLPTNIADTRLDGHNGEVQLDHVHAVHRRALL
jgi:hypothetical protein